MSWKLLAGIFLILILLSSSLAGNLGGLKDKLFSLFGGFGEGVKGSLGGILPEQTTKALDLEITANVLDIKSDTPVILESSSFKAEEFVGTIKLDFNNGKVVYTEDNSKFNLNTKLEGEIKNLKFKKLVLKNLGLKVLNGEWKDTAENGTIEIYDFYGRGLIRPNSFELIGNVSDIIRK